jgi:hypothetical protein
LIPFFPVFFLFFCSIARLLLHNHPLKDLISPFQGSFPMNSTSPGCYPGRSHQAPVGLAGPNAAHFGPVGARHAPFGLVWLIWPSFQTIGLIASLRARGWRMGFPFDNVLLHGFPFLSSADHLVFGSSQVCHWGKCPAWNPSSFPDQLVGVPR